MRIYINIWTKFFFKFIYKKNDNPLHHQRRGEYLKNMLQPFNMVHSRFTLKLRACDHGKLDFYFIRYNLWMIFKSPSNFTIKALGFRVN